MDDVVVMEVIRTRLLRRGTGEDSNSPIRIITQYWSREGELLAEVDPLEEQNKGPDNPLAYTPGYVS